MIKVVSMGGGVNSTAILIGLRDRGERPDAILFADTMGEKPPTYAHVERMTEWCLKNGFPELTRVVRKSHHESLEDECHNNGTLPSKAFGFGGCSEKWKRTPMDKWVAQWAPAIAAWERGEKVQRLIGIHAGETNRGKIPDCKRYTYRFPLREWNWGQAECADVCMKELGYVPVKSACFYCPSMRKQEVLQLGKEFPELAERAIEMERAAKEAGGLTVVRGLGRHWSWEQLLRKDKAQGRLFDEAAETEAAEAEFPDCQAPVCDTCIDW